MSDFFHEPVMLAEVLDALRPKPEGRFADGTVGGGGHAWAILQASGPDGRLYGCDRDAAAIEAACQRLAEFRGRFELRQSTFAELPDWVEQGSCDGVLLDLGVSSAQLDRADRGFSFGNDGPLDMRMDRRQTRTAEQIVNEFGEGELTKIFVELGEERAARRIARAIERERARGRLETTSQLARLVESVVPRRGRLHPATRVFQALRMAVNEELELLQRGMRAAWSLVKPGGRLVILTFHSIEAREVKRFGRELERDYIAGGPMDVPELRQPRKPELRWVSRRPVEPSAMEVAENPRARSAQLRVMEKL